MFVKKNRAIIIALLVLFLLMIIPTSFAQDNGTEIVSYEATNATEVVSIPLEEDNLGAGEIYFDASAESDGDGSASNPYKYLRATRIQSNCNLHFANGEYQLDTNRIIDQVNIIGSDVDKTIIKYDGVAFTVNNQLTVKNITFIEASISNKAKFTANNTVFVNGSGSTPDSYLNYYGGAISTDKKYASSGSFVTIDNCTFKSNYAIYGGAIYMGIGSLDVSNSLFYDNWAYNYGGAIACDYAGNVTISKSKFYNSKSENDAGGSIYIRQSSKFNAEYVDIVNSSSTFGGAITTLNTSVSLSYVNMADNSAEYDGGAVFHMYGNFSLVYSTFDNNSASNGGAVFIDNSTNAIFMRNTFTNNRATGTGGAVYSILNKLNAPFQRFNSANSNIAVHENDYFDTSSLDLTIGSGNYTMYKVNITPIDSLPSRYSLVEDGYITSVKDQQTSGNCWAFTAIAVLESCMLKAGAGQLDLSEENMKNIIALYSDYGWNRIDTNNGGYDNMPWGYLAGWLGPVDEMDDLFDDKSTLSPVLDSIMHVQNIKFLQRSSHTDNDEIKKAILNYGAVGTGILQDSYYLNSNTHAYYCWYNDYCDHAVTIVGWDDDFSRNNFRWGSSNIPGDGAWIVKNSWGSSWEDGGYYYVSYYDANFARPGEENTAYTIILNDTVRFDKNYQYDIAGMTDYFLISSPKVWYKNVFTAASDEYLAAVSTYFEKACNWTASVLVNGELKDVLSGTTDSGYYTFNLNRYISLKSGDVFEVIFNITANGEAFFPISEVVSLNKLVYGPQTSFISYDGVTWQDLFNFTWAYSSHKYNSQVACIKAFTYYNPINTLTNLTVEFMEDQPLNISAIIADEFGNLVKYGNVTFNINGENQVVGVEDGKASYLYDFNNKINSISATFDAEGYASSSNATVYTVPKISVELSLEISRSYNNVTLTIMASKLINETISVDINGNKTFIELINGFKTLTFENLSNGRYDINISIPKDSDYEANSLTDNFIINVSKTTIVATDLTTNDENQVIYNIALMDESNSPIPDKEIIFTVNNSTYVNKTDENGQAVLALSLNKGVYDVDMAFDGDNDYFKSNAKNTIKVKGKVWIDLDVATYKNIAFINVHGSNIINETFTVLVNNEPNYIDAKNGSAHLQLRNLSMGVYNVTALLDDSEYDFNDATSHFTIDAEGFIEINSRIEMSGDDLTISIEIANSTGSILVIVDGNTNAVKLNDGKANYTVGNIAPGNHSIAIIYDDEYIGETLKYEIFNVPRKESEIELTVNNAKVHQKSTILVNVTPDATGLVSVDINGTEYLINLSKTNALEVIFDNAGEYPIVATYLGDDYYLESKSDLKTLVVSEKSPANIKVEMPEDIRVADEFEINVTSDSDCDLIVRINGNQIISIVSEGPLSAFLNNVFKAIKNTYKYTVDKAGIYSLTVFAHETDEFASQEYIGSFYVAKKDAILTIEPITGAEVGDNVTIGVDADSDGELTIKVNGETVTGEYEITKAGAYTIAVESAATKNYNAGFATYTFEVAEPAEYNISVVIDGKEYNVTVVNGTTNIETDLPNLIKNLTEELKESQANASTLAGDLVDANKVIGNLTEELEKSQANASGLADDLVDANKVIGNLTEELEKSQANASGLADDLVDANKVIENLTVELEEAKSNATNLADGLADANKVIGNLTGELEKSQVNATNLADGLADANKVIGNLTGELAEAKDNASGLADNLADANKVIGNLTEELGESQANATNLADDLADANKVIGDLTDELAEAKDNVSGLVEDLADANKVIDDLTAQLKDALDNKTKTVVIDGVEYPIEYVNGTATVATNKTEPDNNITVVVDGKEYPAQVVNGTVTVISEPAKQIATVIESEYKFTRQANDWNAGERGDFFYAVLKDVNGKPLANMPCKVAVNGPIYDVVTDSQGRFGVQVNLAGANTYTYALSFLGNDKYSASFNSTKLVLTAKKTSITAKAKSYKAKATKAFSVTLKTVKNPYDGKTYLSAGKKITLKINGKTYTAKTNAKGIAKFTLKLTKKGKYTAKVTFAGDKTYKASSKSVKITIK